MFTPEDSLVLGGNFVHSFNIPGQIKISQIEDNTKVHIKLLFSLLRPLFLSSYFNESTLERFIWITF